MKRSTSLWDAHFDPLPAEAQALPAGGPVVGVDVAFTPPGDMPGRIAATAAATGQEVPHTGALLEELLRHGVPVVIVDRAASSAAHRRSRSTTSAAAHQP